MTHRTNDLEREDTWDFESAETRPGTGRRRAVVSVAFPREDLYLVSEEAERAGMKLSEFIRIAAVKAARQQRNQPTVFSTTGSVGFTSFVITALTGLMGKARATKVEPDPVTA